jgi:hypothetical protein
MSATNDGGDDPMTARAARQTLSTLLALAFSLMLAMAFSTAAMAQTDDGSGEDGLGDALNNEGDDGTGGEDGTQEGDGIDDGDEGGDDVDGGTDDGFDDGTEGGDDFGTTADDGGDAGFDDGTAESFDDGAAADDGFDDGTQVDAPAGGVEAGFGGLAGDGDPLLTGFLVASLAAIAAVAGLTWWRKVAETA